MHLQDVLNMSISDFIGERKRLEILFTKEQFSVSYSYYTLKTYLADEFLNSKLRGTSLDIDDFIIRCSPYWDRPTVEGLLFYCEMLINLLNCETYWYSDGAKKIRDRLLANISLILEKTSYKACKGNDGFFVIVKKDALASSVIEDIDDKITAKAVLEYNRLDMKGDLKRKKGLLKQIGDYLEPTLQRRNTFTGKLFELADDVSFCLNNLDIRHNNKDGDHKKPFFDVMTDKDLEVLYDDAYRTALLLFELLKQKESHDRIGTMRQKSKGTK
jgi:hypothetical protein